MPIIAKVSQGLVINPIMMEQIITKVRGIFLFLIGIYLIEIVGTLLAISPAINIM